MVLGMDLSTSEIDRNIIGFLGDDDSLFLIGRYTITIRYLGDSGYYCGASVASVLS